MNQAPIKIHLDKSIYVTKLNGKLVVVREGRERLRDICLDLLGEAFGKHSQPKMSNDQKKQAGEKIRVQTPTAPPCQTFQNSILYNPNASLVGPVAVPSIVSPMEPQPGIYRFGDRQLALLPLNPQGCPVIPPQMGFPYPQASIMFPQASNISGFNFPPMGTNPQQLITSSAPPSEGASQTSMIVAKHVCAECGRLRSRKFQYENPLKPGETPPVAFCKKCQKDITSTDESDTSEGMIEQQHKQSKRVRRKKYESKNSNNALRESIESTRLLKVSKSERISRNKGSDEGMNSEDRRIKDSHRNLGTDLHVHEDYPPNRTQASSLSNEGYLRDSRSTSSVQEHQTDSSIYHSHKHHPTRRSSIDSLATDAAVPFYHTRTTPSQSTTLTNETNRSSQKSRNNGNSASSDSISHRRDDLEDPIMRDLRINSEEATRLQRLERSNDRREIKRRTTMLPDSIYPTGDDKDEALIDQYLIRSLPLAHTQEKCHEQRSTKNIDGITAYVKKPDSIFAAEAKASEYYHRDWYGQSENDMMSHERFHLSDSEGVAAPEESHNGSATSRSPHRRRRDGAILPRVMSSTWSLDQGRRSLAQVSPPRHRACDTASEYSSILPQRNGKYITARQIEVATPGTSRNTYRRPYVREATDKETERILMPSPKHSREKLFYPDPNNSDITEEIERLERHVTFRDVDGHDVYEILSRKDGSARVLKEQRKR